MVDFRLNTFLTLCDTMNYRRAAEILNVTQPSVTQHIQYLERYYNCDLFIYDGRKLKMTPQAVILKKYAEAMLYQEKKLVQSLETPKGYFIKIGATRTIGEYVIDKQVSGFLEQTDNNVSIQIDNTNKILELINKGKIDFGIVEGYFNKTHYSSKLYRLEPFVGFCSKNHIFAGKTISIDEVFSQNIIVREKGSGTREMLSQLLIKHNYSIDNFNRTTEINNMRLISSLVANDLGITFAYLSAGEENKKIEPFYIKGCEMFREFDYVYLKDTKAEEFVDIFDKYKE